MTIKFYLKNRGVSNLKTILIRISLGRGQQFDYSTGIKVNSLIWNIKKQRIKDSAICFDKVAINEKLGEIERVITEYQYKTIQENKPITQQGIKETLFAYLNKKEIKTHTLLEYMREYSRQANSRQSKTTSKPLAEGTIRKFRAFTDIFQEFCLCYGKEFDFADMTIQFYNDFVTYLQEEKESTTNTIGKHIRTLKTILKDAEINGFIVNQNYKEFKSPSEEVMNVYLTKEELLRLENLELEGEDDLVRKIFLFGCYTGLRYSDLSRLSKANIVENRIRIRQQKTGGEVVIPLFPYIENHIEEIEEIASVKDYTIRRRIKEICQQAEITNLVVKEQTKGGKTIKETFEKWQLVSTHTARRSFATNLYKDNIDPLTIMAITGHKTQNAFMKYIKASNEEKADILAKQMNLK